MRLTIDDLSPLERARAIDGATFQDSNGRYYSISGAGYRYGYRAHFTGAWICYTDGAYCDCAGGEE